MSLSTSLSSLLNRLPNKLPNHHSYLPSFSVLLHPLLRSPLHQHHSPSPHVLHSNTLRPL